MVLLSSLEGLSHVFRLGRIHEASRNHWDKVVDGKTGEMTEPGGYDAWN